jgi:hypothetical protein
MKGLFRKFLCSSPKACTSLTILEDIPSKSEYLSARLLATGVCCNEERRASLYASLFKTYFRIF